VYGDNNKVNATQYWGFAAGNPAYSVSDNILKISINGDNEGERNNIDVLQNGNGMYSETSVWGDDNIVDVDQAANGSKAYITIDGGAGGDDGEGDANYVKVNQHSGSSQLARVNIYGDTKPPSTSAVALWTATSTCSPSLKTETTILFLPRLRAIRITRPSGKMVMVTMPQDPSLATETCFLFRKWVTTTKLPSFRTATATMEVFPKPETGMSRV
jgi:hypothetical protein